ncbi:hypothetical protein ACFQ60_43045 [Streptomyces zhihengii]
MMLQVHAAATGPDTPSVLDGEAVGFRSTGAKSDLTFAVTELAGPDGAPGGLRGSWSTPPPSTTRRPHGS